MLLFVTYCISDCATAPLCDKLCVFSCCIGSPMTQMWQPVVKQVPPFLSNTFPDPVCTVQKLKVNTVLFFLSKSLTQECGEEIRGRRRENLYLKVLKRPWGQNAKQTRCHDMSFCVRLRACLCVVYLRICVHASIAGIVWREMMLLARHTWTWQK